MRGPEPVGSAGSEVSMREDEDVRLQLARDVKLAEVLDRAGGAVTLADMEREALDLDRKEALRAVGNWLRAFERHRAGGAAS